MLCSMSATLEAIVVCQLTTALASLVAFALALASCNITAEWSQCAGDFLSFTKISKLFDLSHQAITSFTLLHACLVTCSDWTKAASFKEQDRDTHSKRGQDLSAPASHALFASHCCSMFTNCLLMDQLLYSFIHSLVRSFIPSLVHSYSFICVFSHSLV